MCCKIILLINGNPVIIIIIRQWYKTILNQLIKCNICLLWKCRDPVFCMAITTNKVTALNKILIKMRMLTTSYHWLIETYLWGHLIRHHCFNQRLSIKRSMGLKDKDNTIVHLYLTNKEVSPHRLDQKATWVVAVKRIFMI